MISKLFLFISVILALYAPHRAQGAAMPTLLGKGDLFRIDEEPSPKDWQYFMGMSENEKDKLWGDVKRQGKAFKDWSWAWRLAWIRSCVESRSERCPEIFSRGLFDKAMVVRAEAAERLGERFQGREAPSVVRSLTRSFKNPRNFRNGKPLFVTQRILVALANIGTPDALEAGRELSQAHTETESYWKKLRKMSPHP